MVDTFRQLALLAARLFALTASICCISSLFFVYHWVIPWPGDINGADTRLSECVGGQGGIRVEGACALLFKSR